MADAAAAADPAADASTTIDALIPTNSTPSPPPGNALVECDPTAPLPTANAFRQQPIPKIPVEGNPLRKNNLCDSRWQWHRLPTRYTRQIPRSERVVGPDGVTRTETRTSTVNDVASVVLSFDSIWTRQANRFPTSDIMVVNGIDNMPLNWDVPSLFQPDSAVANAAKEGDVQWITGVDTLTLTLGYNSTLSRLGCAAHMEPLIMVGIRCSWGQAIACRYDLSARLLPRLLYDGDVVEAPIGAGQLHSYALDIGAFDVATLTLLRIGHDLTYEDPDEDAPEGSMLVHDFALRGLDAFAAADAGDDDDGGSLFAARSTPITNASGIAELEFFCTSALDAGTWAVAVHAADVQGPLGLAHEKSAPNAPPCTDGYVGPDGIPIYTSPSALGSLPQCNPSNGGNELKPNRPLYKLTVVHRRFSDVPLDANEVRPGCIAYGQMRRYTVNADGESAANLYVALSTRVSTVLIAADRPPTLADYDVASVSHGLDASDAAGGVVPAPDTDIYTTASASPCDLSAARTWHLAVYLADEPTATALGLRQAAFDLNSTLSAARRPVGEEGGEESGVVLPRSEGGVGSTCCGEMTHFVVRVNSSLLALRVRVNVTAGALRAVYLKAATCATYPTDIRGQQCDAQVAQCHMTWYERFDRYTGAKRYAKANTTLVPAGGDLPDKRQLGDWYISIQDAGVARRTDFALEIDAITPPRRSEDAACDRFGRYDCNHDMWIVPADLDVLMSAASPRIGGGGGAPAAALLAPMLALLALWRGGASRAR